MDGEEASVTIEFEATGERWSQINAFSVDEDFFIDADEWSVTVFHEDPVLLRRTFVPKSPIRLYVGDRLQLIGRIEQTHSAGATGLRVVGLDYLGDLVAPGVDPGLLISGGMTLERALLAGLKPLGIDTIESTIDEVRSKKLGTTTTKVEEVDNSAVAGVVGATAGFSAGFVAGAVVATALSKTRLVTSESEPVPDCKPNDNEGALEWAKRLAARSGFTIQPGTKRSAIAVVTPDFNHDPVYTFRRNLDGTGNVLATAAAHRDWSRVPSAVSFRSRRLDTGKKMKPSARTIIPGVDDSIGFGSSREVQRALEAANAETRLRPLSELGDTSKWYCPVYYKDEESKSESQLERAKRRFLAERTKSVLSYDAPVIGHQTPDGAGYAANVMARVVDEIEDIDETMWVSGKTLTFDESGGYMTSLRLILPSSYAL